MLTNLCSHDLISHFGLFIQNSYNSLYVLCAVEKTHGTHLAEEAEEKGGIKGGGEMKVPEFR